MLIDVCALCGANNWQINIILNSLVSKASDDSIGTDDEGQIIALLNLVLNENVC